MGLDMYLTGKKRLWQSRWDPQPTDRKEDGFLINTIEVDLGYWRKHANLHGYIVENFGPIANGGEPAAFGDTWAPGARMDNCQPIELSMDDLKQIIEAVKDPKSLPHTTGFFFGASSDDQRQIDEDVAIFTAAIEWLSQEEIGLKGRRTDWREVTYQASW